MKKVDISRLDDAAKAVLDKICVMATGFPADDLVRQDAAVEFADAAGPEAVRPPTA